MAYRNWKSEFGAGHKTIAIILESGEELRKIAMRLDREYSK